MPRPTRKSDYTRLGAEPWWLPAAECECMAVVDMHWGDGGYGFAAARCGRQLPCVVHEQHRGGADD